MNNDKNVIWYYPSGELLKRLYDLNYFEVAEWETADDFAAYFWAGPHGDKLTDSDETVIRTAKSYWAACVASANAAAEEA